VGRLQLNGRVHGALSVVAAAPQEIFFTLRQPSRRDLNACTYSRQEVFCAPLQPVKRAYKICTDTPKKILIALSSPKKSAIQNRIIHAPNHDNGKCLAKK
jgi:hypothetical protein